MSLKKPSSMILGFGRTVPERVLTNHDLEKMVDTSDEWIRTRTGIERRHIVADGVKNSDICASACRRAIANAGLTPKDIDTILVGTVTGDVTFPATACFVQDKLEAVNAAAMDLQAACSGFLYGLTLADAMISTGKSKYVLVAGSELLSRITDWTDRSTCVLFGDGAGAAVLGPSQDGSGLIDTYLKSDGRLTRLLCMNGGGTNMPLDVAIKEREIYLKMEGPEVFKAAVTAMGEAASHILERNSLRGEDIDLVVPHQANIRIIRATARRIGVPEEKVLINVNEFGNTSAASIPIALSEAADSGRLNRGDLVLLVAFGGGFTWASILFRY